MSQSNSAPHVYLVALEPSGDALGSKLMSALREEYGPGVRFSGVGGETMKAAELETLFDPSDLAILGIFEVIPKLGLVLRRVGDVVSDIERANPDIVVTIDSWGFTGRVHKALTKKKNPVIRVRYVAPQVWAWRPGRAKQLAQWIDHLLTLFPFEPALFEAHGLPSTYVGHPVVERELPSKDAEHIRKEYGIDAAAKVLVVLPGSRMAEVKALTPVFKDALEHLYRKIPCLHLVIPTIGNVEPDVRAWSKNLSMPSTIVNGEREKINAFSIADAAIAASGTVTLELALSRVPHIIAYKVNWLSAFAFKRLAKTKFVNLVNVLLGREVVPECLQDSCNAEVLVTHIQRLLTDDIARNEQRQGFEKVAKLLESEGKAPSKNVAAVIARLIENAKG